MLDLDTVVWDPNAFAVTRDPDLMRADVERFCSGDSDWVIEGCYGSLILIALQYRPELVFLEPGEEACLSNCRTRPWEPHKYPSKEKQDSNLAFLTAWVSAYYERDGELSLQGHRALFEAYQGPKRLLTRSPYKETAL